MKTLLKTNRIKFESRNIHLPSDGVRSEFQRDIHRIMYSDAFRRLRHKTQVFFTPENDHICTRIEHVLHVAEASSTVSRALGLDEDLTRAIALGHDIGHAPFGHHGEEILSEIMTKYNIGVGKFSHEIHGLKVVDRIAQLDREEKSGLNLSFAVRDGIISHCGEDSGNNFEPSSPDKNLNNIKNREEARLPISYEGCIVRIADKIVYAGRDIEDALKAGLISEEKMQKELKEPLKILGSVNGKIVGTLVKDLIDNGKRDGKIKLSEDKDQSLNDLIRWNYKNIYKQEEVQRYKVSTTRGVIKLFEQLVEDMNSSDRLENIQELPNNKIYSVLKDFIDRVSYTKEERNEEIVLDFIAGMTDNYLIRSISEMFLPKAIV
ncbi:MAG: HD domain-containing protein [Spirochaetes bacterium]|nr:HD domain-containing protein [Spirochaetota bacterium]